MLAVSPAPCVGTDSASPADIDLRYATTGPKCAHARPDGRAADMDRLSRANLKVVSKAANPCGGSSPLATRTGGCLEAGRRTSARPTRQLAADPAQKVDHPRLRAPRAACWHGKRRCRLAVQEHRRRR